MQQGFEGSAGFELYALIDESDRTFWIWKLASLLCNWKIVSSCSRTSLQSETLLTVSIRRSPFDGPLPTILAQFGRGSAIAARSLTWQLEAFCISLDVNLRLESLRLNKRNQSIVNLNSLRFNFWSSNRFKRFFGIASIVIERRPCAQQTGDVPTHEPLNAVAN